jgi:hypothetical protein
MHTNGSKGAFFWAILDAEWKGAKVQALVDALEVAGVGDDDDSRKIKCKKPEGDILITKFEVQALMLRLVREAIRPISTENR